jgi:hypothetical protein
MTDRDELLQSILDSDSSADYPAEFQEKYVLMECLSEQKGMMLPMMPAGSQVSRS